MLDFHFEVRSCWLGRRSVLWPLSFCIAFAANSMKASSAKLSRRSLLVAGAVPGLKFVVNVEWYEVRIF